MELWGKLMKVVGKLIRKVRIIFSFNFLILNLRANFLFKKRLLLIGGIFSAINFRALHLLVGPIIIPLIILI